jgi:hypothetical protein
MPIPADISELRKSFHRSFLATVRQFEERVGITHPAEAKIESAPEPEPEPPANMP